MARWMTQSVLTGGRAPSRDGTVAFGMHTGGLDEGDEQDLGPPEKREENVHSQSERGFHPLLGPATRSCV